MKRSLNAILNFARIELLHSLRTPITTIVLFGLPVLLLLIFGTLMGNAGNISLNVAVVNDSEQPFAGQVAKSFGEISAFKLPENKLSLNEAKDKMKEDALDGIIELPAEFGSLKDGIPSGALNLYYDEADTQTGDIMSGIVRGVTEGMNRSITGAPVPITVQAVKINTNSISIFESMFAGFAAMSILMVGIFAVASVFPTAKKTGSLRRLHVTPLRSHEVILGTMLCYTVIGAVGIAAMAALAVGLFHLDMRGDWLTYGVFTLYSLVVVLGFGLAVGSLVKSPNQADIWGQIIFFISLAFGGVWFPRVLMPELMRDVTSYLPMTPIADGILAITTDGAQLAALGFQLVILTAWGIVAYAIGIKLFRWE